MTTWAVDRPTTKKSKKTATPLETSSPTTNTPSEKTTPDLDSLQKQPNPQQKPIEILKAEESDQENTTAAETLKRSDFIYPSNWGQAGLFRIRSAESLPEGALAFGVGGEFYSISDAPDFGYGGTNGIRSDRPTHSVGSTTKFLNDFWESVSTDLLSRRL
jgi:hypothetical protein